MTSKPDLPCADCGKLMWRVRSSLPEGQARCRDCRRQGRTLHAVQPCGNPPPATPEPADPTPPASSPMTILEALERGTRRDLVAAQRRDLATRLASPKTTATAAAAIHRQLTELDEKLRTMDREAAAQTAGGDSVVAATPLALFDASSI